MTLQTPIEMAREVAAEIEESDGNHAVAKAILAGVFDEFNQVRASVAMHARLTAEHDKAVAELVEGLDEIGGLVSFNGGDSNDMNVALDKVYDITQALIAKHRATGETE